MELGQKVKQARLELGLSQRQLCGDVITRNMLSLIENGTATPSLETLRFLSQSLGKPISYFLEENIMASENQDLMQQARSAFSEKKYTGAWKLLAAYRSPDPVFDEEAALLRVLVLLAMAEEALAQGKRPYALELLEQVKPAGQGALYYTAELERRRLLLLSELTCIDLPADDRELLYRATDALRRKDCRRAGQYLDAAQNRQTPYWNYLYGQALIGQKDYQRAKGCFEKAWDHAPGECAAYLEECCRELEDYKGAYLYACRLREMK